MTHRLAHVSLAVALLLIVGACTASGGEESYQPSIEWVDCPPDVDVTFLYPPECGYLTVPADRAHPENGNVKLFVARVEPVGVEPKAGVAIGGGYNNIGDPLGINGDIQTGATRNATVVVQMELRGAGPHVEPSLRCPEIDELDARAPSAATGDPALTAAFIEAVGTCRERLRAQGVDPANFDVAETAEDLEDLRKALDIEQSIVTGAYGTASRYLFEYVRTHPDTFGRLYFDSPWFPEVDELTGGVLGTRAALRSLFAACEADVDCSRWYPDLEMNWQRALGRLSTDPITATYEGADGNVEVLIDAGKLLRMARYALGGDGPDNLSHLPGIITAASEGRATPELVEIVASDPIFCAGYRPLCAGQDGFAYGVYLTTLCRDQVPFMDEEAFAESIDGDPIYRAVFGDNPYLAACDAWDVPPAVSSTMIPFDTDIPTLLLPGQFDSFSPPAWSAERTAGLSYSWTVEIPAMTHNTLGFSPCALEVRADWSEEPTSPPDSSICSSTPPFRFAAPSSQG